MLKHVRNGILGVAVGDALGVPVEFVERRDLKVSPVTDMLEGGTYGLPAGTWSDDTSMTVATLHAMTLYGDSPEAVMNEFAEWISEKEYTPHGSVFDIGGTTNTAIRNYLKDRDVRTCGLYDEFSNGNGALMRILPIALYLNEKGRNNITDPYVFELSDRMSALTHANPVSFVACGIYTALALMIMDADMEKVSLRDKIMTAYAAAKMYYGSRGFNDAVERFSELENKFYYTKLEKDVKSSGYVVDTLLAALWCLLNSDSYEGCVLSAVNLGLDTDTLGAVTGGIAGLLYGVPDKWVGQLARRTWLERMCIEAVHNWT